MIENPCPLSVNQTSTARTAYNARAIGNALGTIPNRPLYVLAPRTPRMLPQPVLRAFPTSNHGAQGRIRTSVARKERQIYSLLPLTARPPVPKHPSEQKPVRRGPAFQLACNSSCASTLQTHHDLPGRPPAISEHAPQWDHRRGQARRPNCRSPVKTRCRFRLSAVLFPLVELAKGFEPPTL